MTKVIYGEYQSHAQRNKLGGFPVCEADHQSSKCAVYHAT